MKCPFCGEELPEGFIYASDVSEQHGENTGDGEHPAQVTDNAAGESTPVQGADNNTAAESASVQETDNNTTAADGASAQWFNDGTATGGVPVQGSAAMSPETFMPRQMPQQTPQQMPINFNRVPYSTKPEKNSIIRGIIASAALVVVIAAVTVTIALIGGRGKAQLEEDMAGTWENSGGLMTDSTLVISGNTIRYSRSFGFMEMDSSVFTYKAVSKDTIEIQGTQIHVDIDKNNGTMTLTPGLTGNTSEIWYAPAAQRPGSDSSSGSSGSGSDTSGSTDSDGVL